MKTKKLDKNKHELDKLLVEREELTAELKYVQCRMNELKEHLTDLQKQTCMLEEKLHHIDLLIESTSIVSTKNRTKIKSKRH